MRSLFETEIAFWTQINGVKTGKKKTVKVLKGISNLLTEADFVACLWEFLFIFYLFFNF